MQLPERRDPRSLPPDSDTPRESPRTATRGVHAGRDDFAELCVHAPPLDLSTTYPVHGVDAACRSLDAQAAGGPPVDGEPIYARLHNPTVARFEQALAEMESAREAVAYASGMAAVTASLLAARLVAGRTTGGHVVGVRPLYGGTDHLLESGLLGLDVTWATADRVGEALREDTVLVIAETPANPTLQLVNIAKIVRQAEARSSGPVPVVVDSTFATPILQRPLEHGATLSLHSATKFLGGHGDVMGGVVATSDPEWAAALRQVRVATGAVLHPMAAYLLHRGLPTLAARVETAQKSAEILARRLAEHPAVASVRFPGFAECDPEGVVGRQMSGPGCLVTFDVEGGLEAASRVVENLRWITPAVSLGSTDTLIQHPAAMTHRVVSEAAKEALGIGESMLRLSVGLEDVEDLWEDLDHSLRAATAEVETVELACA